MAQRLASTTSRIHLLQWLKQVACYVGLTFIYLNATIGLFSRSKAHGGVLSYRNTVDAVDANSLRVGEESDEVIRIFEQSDRLISPSLEYFNGFSSSQSAYTGWSHRAAVQTRIGPGIEGATNAFSAAATATSSFSDTVTLRGNLDAISDKLASTPLIASSLLTAEVNVAEGVRSNLDSRKLAQGTWGIIASTRSGRNRTLFSESDQYRETSGFTLSYDEFLRTELVFTLDEVDGVYRADFTSSLTLTSLTGIGMTTVDALNSFGLTSIAFGDGTTPEQLGFSLEFESGRPSPNISAVPEPNTVGLWVTGAIGMVWVRVRRPRAIAKSLC